ncbi:MAG: tetraacyldisaccharide 4'-kinase [Saprospiraceae bacterium]|jgi:tetraacyldisaccharide 4'-kinase
MHQFIHSQWQKRGLWAWLLSPISILIYSLAWLKRKGYQLSVFKAQRLPLPIIVVGNLSVGGTGKTPLVIYLCQLLKEKGFRPAIISRGYKSKEGQQSQLVTALSVATQVGDEAVLLAQRTGCPVMIGANRVQSVKDLIKQTDCDIVISDDGFQHLKLHRDIDILVRDASRGYGNGWCLPSGPLRESFSAQNDAHLVVHNGGEKAGKDQHFAMALHPTNPFKLSTQEESSYDSLSCMHFNAVAAIGNPERFFSMLESHSITIARHPFVDHHAFRADDLDFGDDKPLIMTEKDAVKCAPLSVNNPIWVVPVTAALSPKFDTALLDKLKSLKP